MRTVIVGCGRVGSSLARQLSAEGDDVAVVDFSESAFNRLGEDFTGEMVFGSAVDEDILRRAGTDRAEAFVAVTDADTTNIMAAQIAQHEFGVKKVICRIYDPARADLYAELGLETICPTTIGAEKVKRFQNEAARPFKRINGAAAILDDDVFAETDLTAADATDHPNIDQLRLIVIRGPSLSSTIAMSEGWRPDFSSAFSDDGTGPMPM